MERMRVLRCTSTPVSVARDSSRRFDVPILQWRRLHLGPPRYPSPVHTDVCARCNGSGRYRRKRYPIMTSTPDGLKRHGLAHNRDWHAQRLDELACCTACRGTGRVEQLTAAASHYHRKGSGLRCRSSTAPFFAPDSITHRYRLPCSSSRKSSSVAGQPTSHI